MSGVADRVSKLIALTASPNENEARNAAFLACKLIREHKLEVRGGAPPASAPRPAPRQATRTYATRYDGTFDGPFDDAVRAARKSVEEVQHRWAPRKQENPWVWSVRAVCEYTCVACKHTVPINESFYYHRHESPVLVICEPCGKRAEEMYESM